MAPPVELVPNPPLRRPHRRRRGFAVLSLAAALCLVGCGPSKPEVKATRPAEVAEHPRVNLTGGVTYAALPTGPSEGVDLLDVDLSSGAYVAVAAEGIRRVDGDIV